MAGYYGNQNLNGVLGTIMKPVRRKVFVSYHHSGDQAYYDEFSRFFHDQYETIRDNSLDLMIQSDNTEYVIRQIREQYIAGTSCTVVLIGAETHQRKYVDWEIKATLDKQHGLVGIALPTHQKTHDGKVIVPDRFHENAQTGYALLEHWGNLTVPRLTQLIEVAACTPKRLIANSRNLKYRNG